MKISINKNKLESLPYKGFKSWGFILTIGLITFILLAVAIYKALFLSPDDVLHGIFIRLLYIHIPFAYSTTLIYSLLTITSIISLFKSNYVNADLLSLAIAPVGTWITLITLITGSVWGQQAWGVWWAWDARLSSVLVLLITYIGYLGIRWGIKGYNKSRIPGAIFICIGAINVPIVKFSVEWWNTVHQPSSLFNPNGIAIHKDILLPLLLVSGALTMILIIWTHIRFVYLKERLYYKNNIIIKAINS